MSASLILKCLANGVTLDDIDESFDRTFPREAFPKYWKWLRNWQVRSMWLLDATLDVHILSV